MKMFKLHYEKNILKTSGLLGASVNNNSVEKDIDIQAAFFFLC